jgi:hypothetical protein
MECLVGIADRVTIDTARYFLSALAQSSAALVAIIGVFAIFRLEAAARQLGECYKAAGFWMKDQQFPDAPSMPQEMIKQYLAEARQGRGVLWDRIGQRNIANPAAVQERERPTVVAHLNAVTQSETIHGLIVRRLVPSLLWWGSIFLLSMLSLMFADRLGGLFGYSAMGVLLILTLVAAWVTRQFVQSCLESPAERHQRNLETVP